MSILVYILTRPSGNTAFHRCLEMSLGILYYPTDLSAFLSAGEYGGDYVSVVLSLVMVCVQVVRRTYESVFVTRFSSSQMHLGHFLLGLFFYTSLGPTALYQLRGGTILLIDLKMLYHYSRGTMG